MKLAERQSSPEAPPSVGDGMTIRLGTDARAYTVVAVSKSGLVVTVQRDEVKRSNQAEDTFTPGGFVGHFDHGPNGQQWTYERDPDGATKRLHWSRKLGRYTDHGASAIDGRHERYDYNF